VLIHLFKEGEIKMTYIVDRTNYYYEVSKYIFDNVMSGLGIEITLEIRFKGDSILNRPITRIRIVKQNTLIEKLTNQSWEQRVQKMESKMIKNADKIMSSFPKISK
jgi:hypothetical protein